MRLTIASAFLLFLFVGIFVLAVDVVRDPDFWWHLRTGEYIVENRTIPHADPSFAYTSSGKDWITHEWLSEVVFWEIYKVGGPTTLSLLFALLICATYIPVYLRSPGKPYVAGFATLLGALTAIPLWNVRPQMFSLFFLSLLIFLLERYFEKSSKNILVFLPLLMLVWVNMHGGFLLGLGVILFFIVGKTAELNWKEARNETELLTFSRRDLVRMAIIGLLCFIIIGINPNGYSILTYPFQTLTSTAMQRYIGEWFSPDFHELGMLPFAVLLMGILALGLYGKKRENLTTIGLIGISAYAALRSVRNVPLFGVLAAPVMASQLSSIFQLKRSTNVPPVRIRVLLSVFICGILLFAGLLSWKRLSNQNQVTQELFPVGATEWIELNQPAGRIFNTYHWGGYLIWQLYPEYPVFIDGRADLFGDKLLTDYAKIYAGDPTWEEFFNRYNIKIAIVEPGSQIAKNIEDAADWKEVYSDKISIIFVKK